jgi:3-hydroxyacyl-[acyl-carrier-protein] dehydratase
MATVPHRYPMLLVDRLESIVPEHSGSALKAITAGAAQGLPPTLIVDALGQLAIMVMNAGASRPPSRWLLGAIEGMVFPHRVSPGDLLRMEAWVRKSWRQSIRVAVRASVEGRTAAEGVLVLTRKARPEGGHE